MEYNSKKEELIIPEYGRHIQSLIRKAREIEDKNERQHFIERIMGLMMQMHPQNRNLEDHRDKLWRHVFQIAEYKLDVTPPGGIIPKPEDAHKKPDRVPYPSKDARFRHYGNNVQKLIAKAISMEEGPKKAAFVEVIGSYMKLAYKTWNREHYVSDDIIIEGLEHLSGGKLTMGADASLDNLTKFNNKQRSSGSNGGGSNSGGGSGGRRSSSSKSGRHSGGGGRSGGGRQSRRRR